MRANALSWCPTLPTCILLASEDHNLYTFDVRSLASPTQIYKGHVAAVMSCDWSPTGTELVSGSWDRTLRIWRVGEGRGSEAYHTKRMQRYGSSRSWHILDPLSTISVECFQQFIQGTHDLFSLDPMMGTLGFGKPMHLIDSVL